MRSFTLDEAAAFLKTTADTVSLKIRHEGLPADEWAAHRRAARSLLLPTRAYRLKLRLAARAFEATRRVWPDGVISYGNVRR